MKGDNRKKELFRRRLSRKIRRAVVYAVYYGMLLAAVVLLLLGLLWVLQNVTGSFLILTAISLIVGGILFLHLCRESVKMRNPARNI